MESAKLRQGCGACCGGTPAMLQVWGCPGALPGLRMSGHGV